MLNVGAGNCLVSLALDVRPSFLPLGTSHLGPPDCRVYLDILSVKIKTYNKGMSMKRTLVLGFVLLPEKLRPLLLEQGYQHKKLHRDI